MNDENILIMYDILKNIEELSKFENYEVNPLLHSLKYLTSQLNYFYGHIAKNKDSSNTVYKLKVPVYEHQLVYINLGRGFPKEIMDGHWCYVLKNVGCKLIVIPTTSIKEDSSYNDIYDMDIISVFTNSISEVKTSRLSFSDIRSVDIQRIDERKARANVLTDRQEIMEVVRKFLGD